MFSQEALSHPYENELTVGVEGKTHHWIYVLSDWIGKIFTSLEKWEIIAKYVMYEHIIKKYL